MNLDDKFGLGVIGLLAAALGGLFGGAILCADEHYWFGIPAVVVGLAAWTLIRPLQKTWKQVVKEEKCK